MPMQQSKLTDFFWKSSIAGPSSPSVQQTSSNESRKVSCLCSSSPTAAVTVDLPEPSKTEELTSTLKRKLSLEPIEITVIDAARKPPADGSGSPDEKSSDITNKNIKSLRKSSKFINAEHASSLPIIMSNTKSKLLSHFRGAMLGSLLGDCYGARSEGRSRIVPLRVIDGYISKGISRYERFNSVLPYTDDTAMCHDTAVSLLNCGDYDASDLARRYAETYFESPDRGYGGNIANTFSAWRRARYAADDMYESARRQFDGRGSYGNGAAMRIAPVPLFYFSRSGSRRQRMCDVALTSSRLTHANADGYNGGLLQALAIDCALRIGIGREGEERERAQQDFSPVSYIRMLRNEYEKYAADSASDSPGLMTQQLFQLVSLIEQEAGRPVPAETVVQLLGNGVAAHKSVATAIYAALWGTYDTQFVAPNTNDDLPHDYSPLQRTLCYAISLGGDADTIASMAGAISGALHGETAVPTKWYESCEAWQRTLDYSDDIVNNVLAVTSTSS